MSELIPQKSVLKRERTGVAQKNKCVSFCDARFENTALCQENVFPVNKNMLRCKSESNLCSPSLRRIRRLSDEDKYYLFTARPDLDFEGRLDELTQRFSSSHEVVLNQPALLEADIFFDTQSCEDKDNDDDGDIFFEVFTDRDPVPMKQKNAVEGSLYHDYMSFWAEIRMSPQSTQQVLFT
jgi:hypothetical protein